MKKIKGKAVLFPVVAMAVTVFGVFKGVKYYRTNRG